jgi:chromosomal replication initiation ATPase DnaA
VAAARRLRFTAETEQIVGAAGVTVDQMRGRGKGRERVAVRRIVAAYLRRQGCSLPEIGRVLDRDHTTVLNLLRTPPRLIGLDEAVAS